MTTEWPTAKLRQTFVDFFEARQHTVVPSMCVVPSNDPTLLFANAGMNQFKPLFLGTADPNTDMGKMKRAVNSQICIRAGGKHNDLEDVGRDTYHHTFFEMLGNWSFGDFFKKEAIAWCWELLTEVYKLPKERLYVTYCEGNENVPADEETRELWRQYVPEERILKGSMKDNFWEMGDTGPCGACTEVHFDYIGGRDAASLVNNDDPTVVELWNLVFMEYNRESDGSLKPLPAKHVDTGMGLERLAAMMQGVRSNYDTDAWTPLFKSIQAITKYKDFYSDAGISEDAVVAYRVVADHIRCITVALMDGATPDNAGRGYVLRRIIRRAIRFGVEFLGAEFGFFHQLVPTVVDQMKVFFAHFNDERNVLRTIALLKDEEESFQKTWGVGMKHFLAAKERSEKAKSTVIAGEDAFILHDRYGFPLDLTTLMADKVGMKVDEKGFADEMKKQSQGGKLKAAKTFIDGYQVKEMEEKGLPTTDDKEKYIWEKSEGKIVAIFNKDTGAFVDSLDVVKGGAESFGIALDRTGFYQEQGGQIYDIGTLQVGGAKFQVNRCHTYGGYIMHIGELLEGKVAVGDTVTCNVDYERRLRVACNHTGTHQLNSILREVLQYGNPDSFQEVAQRGSLVTDAILRFDFSWNSKLTPEQLKAIEESFNQKVSAPETAVHRNVIPLKEAMEIESLRFMADEVYPDPCTLVSIGVSYDQIKANPKSEDLKHYSIELCGGTHLTKLGDIKLAVIISDDALTKGVRRILVYTRDAAEAAVAQGVALQAEFDAIVASTQDVDDKIKAMSVFNKTVGDSDIPLLKKIQLRDDIDAAIKNFNQLKKQIAAQLKVRAAQLGDELAAKYEGAKYVAMEISEFGAEREPLQQIAESLVKKGVAVFLAGVDKAKDKGLAVAGLPKANVDKKQSAVDWIKAACYGKGGGKPGSAQTGFPVDKVDEVVAAAKAHGETF